MYVEAVQMARRHGPAAGEIIGVGAVWRGAADKADPESAWRSDWSVIRGWYWAVPEPYIIARSGRVRLHGLLAGRGWAALSCVHHMGSPWRSSLAGQTAGYTPGPGGGRRRRVGWPDSAWRGGARRPAVINPAAATSSVNVPAVLSRSLDVPAPASPVAGCRNSIQYLALCTW